MIHIVILILGIAAYFGTDFTSDSTLLSFVFPLAFFVAVLYAMLLGVYLVQGRNLERLNRSDEEMRFLAHLNSEFSGGNGQGRSQTGSAGKKEKQSQLRF